MLTEKVACQRWLMRCEIKGNTGRVTLSTLRRSTYVDQLFGSLRELEASTDGNDVHIGIQDDKPAKTAMNVLNHGTGWV